MYISAISHLITLKLKSDFSSNLCFTVLFINLKPHLSFKQLSDLTRSGDLRTVKRVFVSDRMLGTKPLMKALMRGSGNFQIQICFFRTQNILSFNICENKMQIFKEIKKKFREIGSDFGLKFGYNLQCSTCNIQIHLLLSQCCLWAENGDLFSFWSMTNLLMLLLLKTDRWQLTFFVFECRIFFFISITCIPFTHITHSNTSWKSKC